MSRVFRVNVEVGHMEGTQLPPGSQGAFVNVYVGAVTIREALDKVETRLLWDRYRPIDIYAAYELDLEDTGIDRAEEGYPNREDLKTLKETGDIWYGPFHLFPAEPGRWPS